jgi:hypothetical protein
MRECRRTWFKIASTFFLAAFALAPASAEPGDREDPAASETRTPTRITWQPLMEHEGALLTVTGGQIEPLRIAFRAGALFSYELVDGSGSALPDGRYSYELRVIPKVDAEVRQALSEARETGDMSIVKELREAGKLPEGSFVRTGHFLIREGSLETAEGPEEPRGPGPRGIGARGLAESRDADVPTEDNVILDDLIVDGSACVGNDCVNGEAFGFDTIRLKENNLRIKFEDTSTLAGYPTNDWQITANETTQGGAAKFSIDDIDGQSSPFTIEASAPTHSLYVDSSGRVGAGTSTPIEDVHTASGNTPGLRLEQDGSGGFAPQTWDVAGNETNFYVRDATHGGRLPFRVKPAAPSNSIVIEGSGEVGIGTDSPSAPLHVDRVDGTAKILVREGAPTLEERSLLELENPGPPRIAFRNTDPNAAAPLEWDVGMSDGAGFSLSRTGTDGEELLITPTGRVMIGPGGKTVFDLRASGNLKIKGVLRQNSSRDSKENVVRPDPSEILDRLSDLEVAVWNYQSDDPSDRHMSPMAEEFHRAFGLGSDDKHIAPVDLAGVALVAIQALEDQVREKDAEIEALAARVERLEKLLASEGDPRRSEIR